MGKVGAYTLGAYSRHWRLLHQLPQARAVGSCLLHLDSLLPGFENTELGLVSN